MLSREQAQELTDRIKANLSEFGTLIKTARDEKVWLVLGHPSFSDWLQFGVGISRSRAYQLINIATLEDQLREVAEFPIDFTISSRTAQEVINYGTAQFLRELQPAMTEDALANERAFVDRLLQVRQLSPDTNALTSGVVTPISPARDMNRHVFIALASLMAQVNDFPVPDEVENQHLEGIRNKLREAIEVLEEQKAAYSSPSSVAARNA